MPEPASFEAIAFDPLYTDRVATVSLTRGDLFWIVNEVIPAEGHTS
jgi:hypothetical protein